MFPSNVRNLALTRASVEKDKRLTWLLFFLGPQHSNHGCVNQAFFGRGRGGRGGQTGRKKRKDSELPPTGDDGMNVTALNEGIVPHVPRF